MCLNRRNLREYVRSIYGMFILPRSNIFLRQILSESEKLAVVLTHEESAVWNSNRFSHLPRFMNPEWWICPGKRDRPKMCATIVSFFPSSSLGQSIFFWAANCFGSLFRAQSDRPIICMLFVPSLFRSLSIPLKLLPKSKLLYRLKTAR